MEVRGVMIKSPGGTPENSPAIHRWEKGSALKQSPVRTIETRRDKFINYSVVLTGTPIQRDILLSIVPDGTNASTFYCIFEYRIRLTSHTRGGTS